MPDRDVRAEEDVADEGGVGGEEDEALVVDVEVVEIHDGAGAVEALRVLLGGLQSVGGEERPANSAQQSLSQHSIIIKAINNNIRSRQRQRRHEFESAHPPAPLLAHLLQTAPALAVRRPLLRSRRGSRQVEGTPAFLREGACSLVPFGCFGEGLLGLRGEVGPLDEADEGAQSLEFLLGTLVGRLVPVEILPLLAEELALAAGLLEELAVVGLEGEEAVLDGGDL